jgi:catechol 2,3-dioxygenase
MQPFNKLNQPGSLAVSIHPAANVGSVTLKVADLGRSLAFYTTVIGLEYLSEDRQTAILRAGKRPFLMLEEVDGAQPQPPYTTGLYHAAILFPDRRSLARKVAQVINLRISPGYADHRVSEAFYLSDPDGNGLELYRDRPRQEWTWEGAQVRMASDPIDFDDFFAEVQGEDVSAASPLVPSGTRLGHMHLRVANIPEAETFYHEVLGFDVTARWPGALFLSAGGYHHHIGLNTWQSRGGKPPAEPSAGLREFSISLPDQAELERLIRQIESAGVTVEKDVDSALVMDPFQNHVRLVIQNAAI